MREPTDSSMITWSRKRSTRSHRETIMYNIFMTNTLISTQLGHIDRADVLSNAGLIDARNVIRRRISGAFFFRKKS